MTTTLLEQLRPGKSRGAALNEQTIVVEARARHLHLVPPSFRSLFHQHYATFLEARVRFDRPGLVLGAVHPPSGDVETLCLGTRAGAVASAVVGRHGRADLFLDRDASISLRHLVVLARGLPRRGAVEIRAIDLRTTLAFRDVAERTLGAVRSDGPTFLRLGAYSLFLLPTDPREPWAPTAREAWDALPDRRFLDEREHRSPLSRMHRLLASQLNRPGSWIRAVEGPAPASKRLLVPGERPKAIVRIEGPSAVEEITLGESALERGVLVGRYQRCDSVGLASLDCETLSRVHLLLLGDRGTVYAVDTASMNGTALRSKALRCRRFPARRPLLLGGVVRVSWRPV